MKPWHNHIFPRLAQASFLTLTLEPQRVKLYGKVKWDQCRVTNGTVLTLSTPLKHVFKKEKGNGNVPLLMTPITLFINVLSQATIFLYDSCFDVCDILI